MNRSSIFKHLRRLKIGEYIVPILGLVLLCLTSWYSFLLFQTLADVFGVVVCFGLLMLVWNSRRWMNNNYLFVLGIGWACSGAFDLVRIIAVLNPDIFIAYPSDLPIQLWIAARSLQGITLLIAPPPTSFIASYNIFNTRRMWEIGVAILFALSASALMATIFLGWFPVSFIQGLGFTQFEITSEFAIVLVLLVSLGLLWRNRNQFEASLLWMLSAAIGTAVIAEFLLGAGIAPDLQTLVGYGFRTTSYYLIYLAIVQTGLQRPYDLVLTSLEQQEQRYRQMFTEHSAIQLLINLETGAIVQANPAAAQFYGYSVESLQKMNWAQFNPLPPDQNAAWLQEASRRTSDHFIFRQRLASGELRDVQVHATPIQVDRRELLYSIIHDITTRVQAEKELEKHQHHLEELVKERTAKLEALLQEREQAQEELIRIEKMAALGRLVTSLAHEINNPLQALRSGFGLLQKPSTSEEKRTQYVAVASKEIERLISIVERVLGFYRVPNSLEQAGPKAANINSLIDETLILAGKQLEHAHVVVHCELDDALPLVMLYEDQLKQVFLNLILNAMQAMPEGGKLKVESGVLSNGSEVSITFSDTGTGISEQDLRRVFEPFFTTRTNGTGLGLAITYTIVDRHGGRILVESEVGRGSSFAVILPIDGTVR